MTLHQTIQETLYILKYLIPLGLAFVAGIKVTLWKVDQLGD